MNTEVWVLMLESLGMGKLNSERNIWFCYHVRQGVYEKKSHISHMFSHFSFSRLAA